MFKNQDFLKDKLGKVSAKTLSLGGRQFVKSRNEQKIKYAEAFTYTLLSSSRHIRLLKIEPGEDTDVISCVLVEVDLDSQPQYETISYTWDVDPEWSMRKMGRVPDTVREERPIRLNGKTHHVTMNLYHALTELRRRKWDKMVWADQICINQHNNEEKVVQLKLMAHIYSSASTVVIWLGKSSMSRNNALDFMEKLTDQPRHPEATTTNSLATLSIDGKDAQNPMLDRLSSSFGTMSQFSSSMANHYHWLIAFWVLCSQWFTRAWTLQELFLSTNFRFLMGNRDVQSDSIVRAALQIIDFYTVDPLATQAGLNVTFLGLRRTLQNRAALFDERKKFLQGKRYSAQEYLAIIRLRAATVPKDKVFAGTALLEGGALTSVDYNCTTLEIYIAFAIERLWPEAKISALSLVGGTEPSTEGLPTWIPDLNAPLRPEPLQQCGSPTLKTPITVEDGGFHIDGKQLLVKVAAWDVVKATGESIWSWTRYEDGPYNSNKRLKMRTPGSVTTERFGLMFSLLNDLGASYAPTGERTADAFWQTLIGGTNANSSESIEVWRGRFRHWFAFTLADIKSNFWLEKNYSQNRLLPASTHRKWMVPLIADQPALEERVAGFLDFYDQDLDNVDGADGEPQLLRHTINHVAKRLWGVENIEQASLWKGTKAELHSVLRSEEFYNPITKFAELFEFVYAGRRIFTTKGGYLGIGTEGVKAGDVICHVAGATVPYILRPVGFKEGTFTLVGEAYVHGAMSDGEVACENLNFERVTIV